MIHVKDFNNKSNFHHKNMTLKINLDPKYDKRIFSQFYKIRNKVGSDPKHDEMYIELIF